MLWPGVGDEGQLRAAALGPQLIQTLGRLWSFWTPPPMPQFSPLQKENDKSIFLTGLLRALNNLI